MPVQEFIRQDTEEIAAEVRWDFGFGRIVIVHHGSVIAQLDDASQLRTRGMSITTKRGTIVDVQLFDDPHGGRWEIHENSHPLTGLEPRWGTSPDAAGLLHMPSDREIVRGLTSYSYERPIKVGQRWLMYLGFVNFAMGVASTLLVNKIPEKYYAALKTNLVTGVTIGSIFLVLSIMTNRSRALLTLGLGLGLTTVSSAAIGSVLAKDLPFPPITYARFGIHLFGFFVIALGWKAAVDFKWQRRKFSREGISMAK
jgi:hypothetical protein